MLNVIAGRLLRPRWSSLVRQVVGEDREGDSGEDGDHQLFGDVLFNGRHLSGAGLREVVGYGGKL